MNMWKILTGRLSIVFVSVTLLAAALWFAGPDEVLRDLRQFPLWSVFAIIGIFFVNIFVVSFRLSRILAHFGVILPPGVASQASISGHLAGLFIMSLFGQVVGRHLALRRYGVSSVLIASLTVYERFVLALIGGGLCLSGAVHLIGRTTIASFLTELSLVEVLFTGLAGLGLSLWLGRSTFEGRLVSKMWTQKNIVHFMEVGAITLAAQMLVLGAFVVGVLALNPQADLVSVMAAAALISFAASMPVTVNGWGVRELTAVYVLGFLGISNSNALALSILVGLCSTAVILLLAPLALKRSAAKQAEASGPDEFPVAPIQTGALSKFEIEKTAVWLIAMASAVLIFFQVHVALPSGTINLNLADPFAIIALATVLAQVLATRHLPRWEIAGFNWSLVLITALLVFAFVRGAQDIGVTHWALASRLLGWLVLLGYLSIGYLLVSFTGKHGLRRFAETIITTAVAVIIVQVTARWSQHLGFDVFNLTSNFEGYAGNRNAFAFQLLLCSALVLAYSGVQFRLDRRSSSKSDLNEKTPALGKRGVLRGVFGPRRMLFSLLHGVILVGIIYTGSLGGLIAGISLLALAWVLNLADRRLIELSTLVCLLIWQLPNFIGFLQVLFGAEYLSTIDVVLKTHLSGDSSHVVRWQTIAKGLELWRVSPIFGAGLGVFIEQSTQWSDMPIVIHSTPVWMLSEFGLFGLTIFGWAFYVLVRFLRCRGVMAPKYRIILMLLTVFSVFGLVHEIFYQRIFWLVLGAAASIGAASPGVRAQATKLVYHIITGLNAGGAERMLTRLVSAPLRDGVKHSVVSLMDEGVFGREIKAKGVTLHTLGMLPGAPSPRALWRLVLLLRKEKPDVLMSWLYHADLMAFVSGALSGVKHKYWNLRCSDMTQANRSLTSRIMMKILARLSPYTEGVVVNSQAGMLHHQSIGYQPKHWHMISNGVNLDQFSLNPAAGQALRAELGIPEDALLVGHVARFHPMKDHGTLLDAAVKVVQENPRAHFVLMGKNVSLETPFFAERIDNEDVKRQVHLLGGERNISDILSGLDLFVLSSSYGEGTPNVVIEAMASSLTCVVTDVGDAASIVSDTGRVVPIQDTPALSTAIIEQLALPVAERKALGRRARMRVEEHYAIEAVIDRYQTLFLEDARGGSSLNRHLS